MARERLFEGVDHQLRYDQPQAHGNVGMRHAFVYDDLDRELSLPKTLSTR